VTDEHELFLLVVVLWERAQAGSSLEPSDPWNLVLEVGVDHVRVALHTEE
jgi:hypothetical protein